MVIAPTFKGRKRIELNISRAEFLKNPMEMTKTFLGRALGIHNQNVNEMEKIHNELVGDQTIKNKSRSDGSNINNKIVENHLYKIWRFKTSYIVGRPIQYSNKTGEDNDDMKYFNRYLQDCGKQMHDIDVYSDVFEFGVGYRMVIPTRKVFDTEWESPIEDFYLNPKETFIAYSSGVAKDELFSCLISYETDINTRKSNVKYTIYYVDENGDCCAFDLDNKKNIVTNSWEKQLYKGNPVIEYTENKYRMGVPEVIIGLQNALNGIDSLQLDDIEQFIQAYLVFLNIDVDLDSDEGVNNWKKRVELYKSTRAMVLNSTNEQIPADFKQITNSLEHNAINQLRSDIKSAMYDIVSAPMSSGSVTSGGDTTGARLLGNGWESALGDSNLSTTYLKGSEYKWLKFFINECRNSTNTINEVYPSMIEIKYDINLSDNILVKTQAISNLYNANVPKELILTAVPILSDVYGSSKKWEEFDNELKEMELDNKNNQTKNVSVNDINDLQNKANSKA